MKISISLFLASCLPAEVLVVGLLLLASCGNLPSIDQLQPRTTNNSSPATTQNTGAILKLAFLDVGQGDSTLILASRAQAMLIDAGPPGTGSKVIVPFLKKEGVTELQYIVATHNHEDHTGGITEVTDEIPAKNFIDNKTFSTAPPHSFSLGQATVDVLAANGQFKDGTQVAHDEKFDENAASIALLVTLGDFKYLHASDITGGGGDAPYQTSDVETKIGELAGDIDVLRVAHHGSKTSSNKNFIEAIDPEIAIISVGDDNDFGQPHDDAIDRLLESGAEIYLTEGGWLGENYINNDAIHIANGTITISATEDGEWEMP